MWIGCIRAGMVTADSWMTNAGVFLGDLTKCSWARDMRAAVAPCWLAPLWVHGSLEALYLHECQSDSTWETQPSAPHISRISLPLWEWHCPRKTTSNTSWGTCLGKPTATPWFRRPQVPPSVCCDQVPRTPASAFSWAFYSQTSPSHWSQNISYALLPCIPCSKDILF